MSNNKQADRIIDGPRRSFLLKALVAGWYSLSGSFPTNTTAADIFGNKPEKLKAGQSFYRLDGEVSVNGKPATIKTRVTADDTLVTGKDSKAIFVVGQDAFLLRENSQLKLARAARFKQRRGDNIKTSSEQISKEKQQFVVDSLRLVTGAVLTVFGKTEHQVSTSTATVGIRGTGVYLESESEKSYVCTCYGETEISSVDDPTSIEVIDSGHHDEPRYILKHGINGQRIIKAPMKNHTDLELVLIEALVGRTPPFSVSGNSYNDSGWDY